MSSFIDENAWKLVLIGLLSGILASFFGGGAEILIVPMLVLLNVFDNYKSAIGTSLASLLLPIGIFAVYFYMQADCNNESCVNWKYAILIAISFTIGTLASYFTVKLNTIILKLVFAIILICFGIFLLIFYFTRQEKLKLLTSKNK